MRVPLTVTQAEVDTLSQSRSCGGCTACCVLPRIVVSADTESSILADGKPGYTPCQHLNCNGCAKYDKRPEVCRGFLCLWRSGHIAGDERRRPDNLGLMFTLEQVDGQVGIEAWELWQGAASDHPGRGMIDALYARIRQGMLAIRYYGVPAALEYRGPESLAHGQSLSDGAMNHPRELAKYLRQLIARKLLEMPEETVLLTDIYNLEDGVPVTAHFHR